MYFAQPGKIGRLELRNRFVMAPVKTAYGTPEGRVTQRHLRFYANVARGGVGLVILEPVSVTQSGKEHPKQLTIHRDSSVGDLQKIVDVLHAGGALACLNLNHAGRAANPKATGVRPKAPSILPCPTTGQTPEVLTEKEIQEIVDAFGEGVERASAAGFDAVEIQCGHGYLISQFLSERTNQREDRFGKNRELFLEMVLTQVAAHRGNLAVLLRISTSEFLEGGLDPAANAPVLQLASKLGFDAIHCGMGNACDTPPFYYAHMAIPEAPQIEALRKIQSMTKLPLIAAGKMADLQKLESFEREKLAEFVAFGRAIVADSALPSKLCSGSLDEIVFCGFCLQGCLANVKNGSGLGCIVNPSIDQNELNPEALSGRRVAVVGAGPAGLSAAATCAEMGARVSLFEKKAELGGQFRLAPLAPHKELMRRPLDGLVSKTRRLVEDVRLGMEAGPEDLEDFDHVIVATGSKQRIPEIEGLDSQFWMTSLDFFEDPTRVRGRRILIIGAGMVGVEAAELLADRGLDITATKRSDTIANDMEMITKKMMLKRFETKERVKLAPETTVLALSPEGVRVRERDEEKILPPFDTVIVAAGMEPEAELFGLLRDSGIPASRIGDARTPADIFAATQDGYAAALNLLSHS